MHLSNNNPFKSIIRLWAILDRGWKLKIGLLVCFMFISGFAEIITLGSVVPFLAVLVDPEQIFEILFLSKILTAIGISEQRELVVFFSLCFSLAILISSALRLTITRLNLKWCYALMSDLSIKAFERTIFQSYLHHTSFNSSEFVSAITVKISTLQTGLILPVIATIQVSILIISLISALIFILPLSNVLLITLFGAVYALLTFFLRSIYRKNSKVIASVQVSAIKVLQESLAGIRDMILGNFFDQAIKKYSMARVPLDDYSGKNAFMIQAPRFIIEAMGMLLIVFLVFYNFSSSSSLSTVVPTMGALALGAQRLLPYLQQLYASISAIYSSSQSVIDALDILEQPMRTRQLFESPKKDIRFEDFLELRNISFSYEEKNNFSITDFSLKIPKGSKVGIIGSTGSGKSTIMDLMMGLITPQSGSISIDNHVLSETEIKDWQREIFHVPQNIILLDASIKENIALGQDVDEISLDRVKSAAKKADLVNFIESLPDGYDSLVGERGAKLSGGQRQRIAIARALYKGGSILFLDEATNALDMETESNIMGVFYNLLDQLTAVIIAHNLDTVKNCDEIIIVSNGSIVERGTFDSVSKSAHFKALSGELA